MKNTDISKPVKHPNFRIWIFSILIIIISVLGGCDYLSDANTEISKTTVSIASESISETSADTMSETTLDTTLQNTSDSDRSDKKSNTSTHKKTTEKATKKDTNSNTKNNEVSDIGTLKFTVLDVHQGLSILIENGEHTMIYDGGPAERSSYVVSYLNKRNITHFDYMVASHYDSDHISGLVGVLKKYNVDRFIGPNYTTDTRTYKSLVSTLASNGIAIRNPNVGDTFKVGNASVRIVAPNSTNYESGNDYSIALVITFGKNTFYMAGDAEKDSISEIMWKGTDINADVYVAGHHGSHTSTTAPYLNAINPKYTIISCGEGNSYGHPHEETMELLKNQGCKVFRTDKQGEIIITCDGKNYNFNVDSTNDYSPGDKSNHSKNEITTDVTTVTNNNSNSNETYIGNLNSKKFHRESCNSLPLEKNRIYFSSRDEAIAAGYQPCKICNP